MIDKETSVPIHFLDKCPFNPKTDIHGVYKDGLKTSLDYFNVCDRLKVWPDPKHKGRYIIINGNQRIDLIIELRILEKIREHFGLNKEHEFDSDLRVSNEYKNRLKSIRQDPENEALLKKFHLEVMQSKIDVLIMDRLDPDDARLFVATYDRNRARPDEAKIVSVLDDIANANRRLIDKMVRPEKAYINPLPKPDVPHTPQVAPDATGPIHQPTPEQKKKDEQDYGKWGPPPPTPNSQAKQYTLIPFTLSLTPEGHRDISERILKNSARLFRENKLKTALEQLESALDGGPLDTESILCEVALLTLNRHIKAAEKS